jgi:cyanophycinase
MPAPVPPGYTRGPLLFLNPSGGAGETTLLQRFWTDAGSYGARILLVTTTEPASAESYQQLFRSWESDTVQVLTLGRRAVALQAEQLALVEQATAILLLDADPRQLARWLGGTPLAQAIRRANARNKTVAALGAATSLLCQHMATFDPDGVLHFTPGLGLINRIVFGRHTTSDLHTGQMVNDLLQIVAPNPFVVAVQLAENSGVAVYPDTTLEVFGINQVFLLDGAASSHEALDQLPPQPPLGDWGIQLHALPPGAMFHFDQRVVLPPPETDLPQPVVPATSKSPF